MLVTLIDVTVLGTTGGGRVCQGLSLSSKAAHQAAHHGDREAWAPETSRAAAVET